MAGTFILGETKVRPGSYFNIQKKGGNAAAGVMNGVTAVIFKADFGPLNTAVELSAEDGYERTFGTGLTTDAMKEAIAGGAKTIIACRVGNGGSQGTITLKDTDEEIIQAVENYRMMYDSCRIIILATNRRAGDGLLSHLFHQSLNNHIYLHFVILLLI